MSKKTIGIGIALSVVMAGVAAYAQQDDPDFQKGDRTFSLGGSGSSDNDFDSNNGTVDLELGYFVADSLAVALRQGAGFANVNNGRDDWTGSTRLGLDWFFGDLDRVNPYVGANIGYIYGDGVKEQFIAGPDAGIRFFLNDTTYVSLGVEYQILFEDSDEAGETYDDGRIVYGLSMGLKF